MRRKIQQWLDTMRNRSIPGQLRMGKARLSKYYMNYDSEEKIKLLQEIHGIVTTRDPKFTNFVEYRTFKIVYRRYAGLFFCLGISASDNELAALEFIHLFVEILDKYFGSVCELDLVFNFYKIYPILDELMLMGEITETSRNVVLSRLSTFDKLD